MKTRAVRNNAWSCHVGGLFPYWWEWRMQLEVGAGDFVMSIWSCYQLWIWHQWSNFRTVLAWPSLSIKISVHSHPGLDSRQQPLFPRMIVSSWVSLCEKLYLKSWRCCGKLPLTGFDVTGRACQAPVYVLPCFNEGVPFLSLLVLWPRKQQGSFYLFSHLLLLTRVWKSLLCC